MAALVNKYTAPHYPCCPCCTAWSSVTYGITRAQPCTDTRRLQGLTHHHGKWLRDSAILPYSEVAATLVVLPVRPTVVTKNASDVQLVPRASVVTSEAWRCPARTSEEVPRRPFWCPILHFMPVIGCHSQGQRVVLLYVDFTPLPCFTPSQKGLTRFSSVLSVHP